MEHLYEVQDLAVSFTNEEDISIAVDGVSFHVDPGEIISFVGESGSGKSVTQMATLQLLATPPAKIERGVALLEGEDLLRYRQNGAEMREVRGGRIGMIFQEPMTSLDPIKTVGYQLSESILLHQKCSEKEAQTRAAKLLSDVGIPDAATRLGDYPHQFSGGMRQRIMIAIAISGNPRIIVADEPTTALDVTTQAQIL
jgi:peptide/nickel transport system ATP-binding protein